MISIVTPAYNVGEKIVVVMNELKKSVDKLSEDYEILVVDDGSTDSTFRTAKELEQLSGNGFKVITYNKNRGKGYALKYGFEHSRGDLVFFIDADGDLPPEQMKSYLKIMERSEADVVIGSKKHPESKVIDYPQNRRILSLSYHLIIRTLFRLNVKDTQVGLKLFKREVLEEIMPTIMVKRYAFDIELLANAIGRGYRIVDAPVELTFNNDSRIDWEAIWHMFVDTMAVAYRMHILDYYNCNNGLKDVKSPAERIDPTSRDKDFIARTEITMHGMGTEFGTGIERP